MCVGIGCTAARFRQQPTASFESNDTNNPTLTPRPPHQTPPGYTNPTAPELAKLASQKALVALPVPNQPLFSIPQSFLGLSVDLNDIEGVAHPDYVALIKRLTAYETGPMVR